MATTENFGAGNGSKTKFPFTFPYLKQTDVEVYKYVTNAWVKQDITTHYTFDNATTIKFGSAPATATSAEQEKLGDDKNIKIKRNTSTDALSATFYPGSAIRSVDLNDNFTQNLYSAQEIENTADPALTTATAALPADGSGKMTGNLVFEGSSDDAHETTLTVTDPTADRTITLPNQSGTVPLLAVTSTTQVTATPEELNYVDGVTSNVQTQLNAKQPLDDELTELATMASNTAAALADLTQAEVQILDGATVTTTELNKLGGVTASTTNLNITDSMTKQESISSTHDSYPTSAAVVNYVLNQLEPIGGLEVIANKDSFPETQPAAGVVISIADAAGIVVDSNGSSTTPDTITSDAQVTINNINSAFHSSTVGTGIGWLVTSTGTGQVYNYHKANIKESDVVQLSDDINDFNSRYRVASSAPGSDNDTGDLYFNTSTPALHVYNGSAWIPGVSTTPNDGTVTSAKLADDITIAGTLGVTSTATFEDNVVSNKLFRSDRFTTKAGISLQLNSTDYAFAAYQDSTSPLATIGVDGAASFAGGEMTINNNGYINKVRGVDVESAGTYSDAVTKNIVSRQSDGTESASITAAGAATFKGVVKADRSVSGDGCFHALLDGAVTAAITSAGSATFADKVGIGTTSPTKLLHVSGTSSPTILNKPTDSSPALFIADSNRTGAGQHLAQFRGDWNGTTVARMVFAAGDDTTNKDDGSIGFFTSSADNLDERMRISSAGKVGIGITDGDSTLDVKSSITSKCRFRDSNGSNETGMYFEADNTSARIGSTYHASSGGAFKPLAFYTSGSAKMSILADGKVGIGNSSPGYQLSVLTTGTTDTSLHLATTGGSGANGDATNSIRFTGGTNTRWANAKYEAYAHIFEGNGAEKVRINKDGNVGINVDPGDLSSANHRALQIHSTTNSYLTLTNGTTGSTQASDGFSLVQSGNDTYYINRETTGSHYFSANGSDRFAIKDDGNVGIGTTSPKYKVCINHDGGTTSSYNDATALRIDGPGAANELVGIGFSYLNSGGNTPDHIPSSWIGVKATDWTSYVKTDLIFATRGASTNTEPTERMRIMADGTVLFGTTANSIDSSNFGTRITSGNHFSMSRNVAGTSSVSQFYGNAGELRVMGDGDCLNTNNSYGSISDVKLKENIADANSQWNDIKALKVRNYNFKESTGFSTHKQIGLIAQEVESISPGLVGETNDTDSSGNETGTVTKSVNYSVLNIKVVKALQEAIAKIETLETKVAALEAA